MVVAPVGSGMPAVYGFVLGTIQWGFCVFETQGDGSTSIGSLCESFGDGFATSDGEVFGGKVDERGL